MRQIIKLAENYFKNGHKILGINYQRRYPEELCRFLKMSDAHF